MKSWLALKNIHYSPPNFSTSAANSVTPPRLCSPSTSSNLRFSSFMINLQSSITHSSSYPNTSSGRCRATSAGPPSPPQTEPPDNDENSSSSPGYNHQSKLKNMDDEHNKYAITWRLLVGMS
ncbi:uncharacterized protein LOC107861955 isoform X2 [Capsicum annuum]|uniref:uncharacterized protein LOC107861955 isoform X2 n=1 Tax=Capsicum annuum TaxID=4072 RepID=UPI001FB0BEA5|nr:uncharacterized protein LOC107861955 isoform X2 [Capsicum annuum]